MNFLTQLFPEENFALLGVILGLPLLGAIVNGIWGRRLGKAAVRLMALGVIGLSFAFALITFIVLAHAVDATGHAEVVEGVSRTVHEHVKLSWLAWDWLHTTGGDGGRDVAIPLKFSVDALSGVMMLVVTGVGFLIHLYSSSYMAEDKAYWKFFTYLNLFIFSMLVLILGDNLPVLFVGWEGVGLCSYLLIGFWYDKMPNAAAGKKAFIANRIGDFGLICGMFLLAHYTGALDWTGIQQGSDGLLRSTDMVHLWPIGGGQFQGFLGFLQPKNPWVITGATAAGMSILLGCTGKSAQLPLYVWLPDAMAGPTPVSALIHAATMVTAGLYLICRLSFVFVLSPFTMMMIACVGAATALFAATIALVQNDIKKVLAYSTVSQLGFMFLGVGVGAFSAGFFHVFTHAFFKACLFLGAGSVIHSMHARIHDDVASQDIRNMGGLKKYMPLTFWTFMVSTLAIAGCPLTSGFFSKDEILFKAFTNHLTMPAGDNVAQRLGMVMPPPWLGPVLYVVGVLAATMTAFYMFRLTFVTFFGEFRGWTIGRPSLLAKQELAHAGGHDDGHAGHDSHDAHGDDDGHAEHEDDENDDHGHHHEDLTQPGYAPHESPWQMTVPLIILGTFAAFAGFLNAGPFKFTPMEHWLDPVFEGRATLAVHASENAEKLMWPLAAGGVAAFVIGTSIAYWMYVVQAGAPAKRMAEAAPGLHTVLLNKWYVDEAYDATVLAAVDALADTAVAFDWGFIDRILARVSAVVVAALGTLLRYLQNGVVHLYAAMMVVGTAGLSWFFIAPHADVEITDRGNGDYIIDAAPGMGYRYRWDANGDGQWDQTPVTAISRVNLHLDPGQSRTLKLEAVNAFGFVKTKVIPMNRPVPAVQPEVIGQNP